MRTISNPPSRFEHTHLEWESGEAPLAVLRVHEERVKSIISENRSPDLPFRYSINPYRGCQHGCAYCYARPSHQYWGYGAGTDFERQIIVKVNAPDLLREAFARPKWSGEPITFSGNTDCYQPLEGRYRLTRALLGVCLEHRNPVTIITKSVLILQDLALLTEFSRVARLRVFFSIPFVDDAVGRALEPGAASVSRRFAALSALSQAGIETGLSLSPLIPGLSESAIVPVLRRAREAGARYAFSVLLRLPAEVAPVFFRRLQEAFPLRAGRVESALRDMRNGRLASGQFFERLRGSGPRFWALQQLFDLEAKRLGFVMDRGAARDDTTTFRRIRGQLPLF